MVIVVYLPSLETAYPKSYIKKPFQVLSWLSLIMGAFSGPEPAFSGPKSLFFCLDDLELSNGYCYVFAFSWNSLTQSLHRKTISGPVLADPEKWSSPSWSWKWVHLVGPDLHLVGTINIFTIFSQGKVLYDKFHTFICTYVKGNNNPPGSYWEIFHRAALSVNS